MKRRSIADLLKSENVVALQPDSTVREATQLMARRKVGSVVVTDGHDLVGIVTERDVMNRVDAQGLDQDRTALSEIMTRQPRTVSPDEPAVNGLRVLKEEGFRHLPVTRGKRLVGVLSTRDFTSEEMAEIEEEIAVKRAFVEGGVEHT